MRRFEITSPKFTGAASITYNDKNTLCVIDCKETDMDEITVHHFKKAVPVTIKILETGESFSKETQIVEADFVVTFEMFYADYPLKRNRYKVEQAWNKMNKSDQVRAFSSLPSYKKYLNREGKWLKPMIADRYLNTKEYLTEWNKIN